MRNSINLNQTILLFLALFYAIHRAHAAEPDARYLLQEVQRLIDHSRGLPLDIRTGAPALKPFYSDPTAKPLWTSAQRRDDFLAVLTDLDADGLAKTTRAVGRLSEMGQAANSHDVGLLALMELTYSTYLIKFVTELRLGHMERYEQKLDMRTRERIIRPKVVLSIASYATSIKGLFENVQPNEPDYRQIKERLKDFLSAERRGGWLPVTLGHDLSIGDRDPRVSELKRRLAASGELSSQDASGNTYDAAMTSAVSLFQRRHGLAETGKVDRRTLLAMNVPLRERIKQLQVNLERWRWFDDARPGPRWILNTATRQLFIRFPDRPTRRFDLTLSNACRQRPAFDTTAREVIVNPPYNVPTNLAARQILPLLKRDPSKLDESFTILLTAPQESVSKKIAWGDYDERNFPFTIIQRPHPTNPLGHFQVPFDKVADVSLHGNPSRRPQLRVEDPCAAIADEQDFLDVAFPQREPSYGIRIDLGTSREPGRRINLPVAIPVVFIYATVWLDTEGELIFGADPLGRDAELHRLLTNSEVS